MKEKILIIEKSQKRTKELQTLLSNLGYEQLFTVDALDTAQTLIHNVNFNLIIFSGISKHKIERSDYLESIGHSGVPTIFIADQADDDLYMTAQQSNLIAFLVRPLNPTSLKALIQILFRKKDQEHSIKPLAINEKFDFSDIPFRQVKWVQVAKNYCHVVTDEKTYIIRLSLKALLNQLPANFFTQVHRAYIVQLAKIDSIHVKQKSLIIDGKEIPISRNYKRNLLEQLKII